MKKSIALFMIVNVIMVFFTVINIQDVNAEQKTCCVMEDSCSLLTTPQCSSIGGDTQPTGCADVPICDTGCCVTATGCNVGKTQTWCRQNGGSWDQNNPDCSTNTECVSGSCTVNGQCFSDWTKRQCDAAGPGATFSPGISDPASCNAVNSDREGCCILGTNYFRTTQNSCNGGRFVSNYLCSFAPVVTGTNCLPRDHKTCGKDGKVYWVDSCGNLENVADNGRVHASYTQDTGRILSISAVKNYPGNCDISKGNLCGKDSSGELTCLDVNCDAGESYYIETNFDPGIALFLDKDSVKIEGPKPTGDGVSYSGGMLGETYWQQKGDRIFLYSQSAISKDKDNKGVTTRKNGERWCMMWSQPTWDAGRGEAHPAAPGSRDYVFKCEYGKIKIEPCSDYRGQVCTEGYDINTDMTSARCEDNAWEGCIGASRDKCNDQNLLCRFVKGECVPIYPPGNVFWGEDTSAGNDIKCEKCGANPGGGIGGFWNTCNDASCVRLGDCKSMHINFWSRVWRGALVAAIVVATYFGGPWLLDALLIPGGSPAAAAGGVGELKVVLLFLLEPQALRFQVLLHL